MNPMTTTPPPYRHDFTRSTEGRKLLPIAFSDAMVRALLRPERPKTRTRRLLPRLGWTRWDGAVDSEGWPLGWTCEVVDGDGVRVNGERHPGAAKRYPCKFGPPGSVLYVQERLVPFETNKSGSRRVAVYGATGEQVLVRGDPLPWRWKVNIIAPRYCPAEVARLRLENTLVRGEFLTKITEEESMAEGLEQARDNQDMWLPGRCLSPTWAFRELWNSIHTEPSERWEDDPAVLVLGVKEWERRAAGPRVGGGA